MKENEENYKETRNKIKKICFIVRKIKKKT